MPNKTMTTSALPILDSTTVSAFEWALRRLLMPVARLCLVHGITYAAVAEILKRSFVQEVISLHPEAPEHGMVSRISTATGINRREVTRLTRTNTPVRASKPPLAAELIARWSTDPDYLDQAVPRILKRQGEAPSFEALASALTRDVHPRSILDELIRLGLVEYNEPLDRVSLERVDFVPQVDTDQMFTFLGDNVGDHLAAAVANVTGVGDRHMEQAVFADELSRESAAALHPLISSHWADLRTKLVPVIIDLIEEDKRAGRRQDQRVRVGIYSFAELDASFQPPQQRLSASTACATTPEGVQL